jgi:transposase-like protein
MSPPGSSLAIYLTNQPKRRKTRRRAWDAPPAAGVRNCGETSGSTRAGLGRLWGVAPMPKKRSSLPLGPTIQAKPEACPACDGHRVVKDGLRKNSFRQLQVYWCKDCRAHFSSLAGLKGVKYPPRVIARALCLYNLGHSQEKAARRIASEHRITVPRRTISDWIPGYRPITTFHRLRAAAVEEFGNKMLRERTLDHQQVYQFKVHLPKLAPP